MALLVCRSSSPEGAFGKCTDLTLEAEGSVAEVGQETKAGKGLNPKAKALGLYALSLQAVIVKHRPQAGSVRIPMQPFLFGRGIHACLQLCQR